MERIQMNISVTMRTPGFVFVLALGFLFTEGIIRNYSDIAGIKYSTELNRINDKENIVRIELKENIVPALRNTERNFYTTSSCGVCGKASIDAIKTVCEITPDKTELRVDHALIVQLPG